MKSESYYSIRQVIELTGVSEFLLRAWELRYNAIQPKRTPTGRRLYRKEDVIKITSLNTLTQLGFRISQISHYSNDQLQKLIQQEFTNNDSNEIQINKSTVLNTNLERINKIIIAASNYDIHRISFYFQKSFKNLDSKSLLFDFILPLCHLMSVNSDLKKLNIAQEHLLTDFIKQSLHALRFNNDSKKKSKNNFKFILATPEGDMHDIGLLIGCCMAKLINIETIYLGPHIPKKDLAEVCTQTDCTHLLIVSTLNINEGAKEDILTYLNFLDKNCPNRMNIWLSGRNTHLLQINTQRKVLIINDFNKLNSEFKNITQTKDINEIKL